MFIDTNDTINSLLSFTSPFADSMVAERPKKPEKINHKLYHFLVIAGLIGREHCKYMHLTDEEVEEARDFVLPTYLNLEASSGDIFARNGFANIMGAEHDREEIRKMNKSKKKLPGNTSRSTNAHHDDSTDRSNYVSPFADSVESIIEDYEYLLKLEIESIQNKEKLFKSIATEL